MNKLTAVIGILIFSVVIAVVPAMAAQSGITRYILAYQESLVPEGQSVENVLLVEKDGVIAGEVKDEVVVIKGNVTLKSTAKVADSVLVIGGDIKQEPGAQVRKGVFNISTSSAMLNSLILGLVTFVGIEAIKLVLSVGIILAGMILMSIAPNLAEKSAEKLKGGLLKSAVMGIFCLLSFGLLIAALATSIWGIPFELVIVLLLLILLVIGCSAVGFVFGEVFKNGTGLSEQSKVVLTGIGSLILVALLNLPVIGPVWGLIVVVLSLGSSVQLLFEKRTI